MMASRLIRKVALILQFLILQFLIFLFDCPNQPAFTFPNAPAEPSCQHTQFNHTCPCCMVCPTETRPQLESKTSAGLLCKLVNVIVLYDLTEPYCKSIRQCLVGFDIARMICADLNGKQDESDDSLRAILEIIFNYNTTVEDSNEEQRPT